MLSLLGRPNLHSIALKVKIVRAGHDMLHESACEICFEWHVQTQGGSGLCRCQTRESLTSGTSLSRGGFAPRARVHVLNSSQCTLHDSHVSHLVDV